jgi:uncharacterized protein YoxC
MHALHHVAQALLQAVPHSYPDTIVTKQVMADTGLFQKLGSVAGLLLSIALIALSMGFLVMAWSFRKTYKKVDALLDRVYGDITPVVRSAGAVAEDAREIVASLKGDARMVQQTVAAANSRLLKAVRQTEARINEFNALLEVVQDEAESTVISTVATVRGVRTGLRTGLGQMFDTMEEEDDGDIIGERSDDTAYASPARPRVKPKRDEYGIT